MYNRLDSKLVYLETDQSEEIYGKWKPKKHSHRQGYSHVFTIDQINGDTDSTLDMAKLKRDTYYFYIFLIAINLSIVSAITQNRILT